MLQHSNDAKRICRQKSHDHVHSGEPPGIPCPETHRQRAECASLEHLKIVGNDSTTVPLAFRPQSVWGACAQAWVWDARIDITPYGFVNAVAAVRVIATVDHAKTRRHRLNHHGSVGSRRSEWKQSVLLAGPWWSVACWWQGSSLWSTPCGSANDIVSSYSPLTQVV